MKYLLVFSKSLFFYLLITVVYRIMGKREIGELSIMDFIVSIFIAELAAISIENYKDTIWLSIIPIFVLVLLQIVSSKISLKHEKVREVIDGKASVIINRGKINFEEMLKQRYNLDDLLVQLRDKGYRSIEEVEYAVLESSGTLSVFPYKKEKSPLPLPIILDGDIQEDTLKHLKKDKKWVLNDISESDRQKLHGLYNS